MKKQQLILWIGIVLIVSFFLIDQFVYPFDATIRSMLICAAIFFVALGVIDYLKRHNLDKRSEIKASGRLYFKETTRKYGYFGRMTLCNKYYIFKIEVGAQLLEFFVPADLYYSIENGNKVSFGYNLVGENYRWINWIESYR